MTIEPGRCSGIGVGPGDPELITVKAMRRLMATPVVAYFAARDRESNARRIVAEHLTDAHEEVRLVYPVTTEKVPDGESYDALLADFYDESAKQLAEILDGGRDVVVLCEGDPFLYGSFMYLSHRLDDRYRVEVVPGVPAMLAGAAILGTPLVSRNEELRVLSGVLPVDVLATRLSECDAAVVMKVGRNLDAVIDAARRAGVFERAYYVERATMTDERVMPLRDAIGTAAPYFSMVVIPSVTAILR